MSSSSSGSRFPPTRRSGRRGPLVAGVVLAGLLACAGLAPAALQPAGSPARPAFLAHLQAGGFRAAERLLREQPWTPIDRVDAQVRLALERDRWGDAIALLERPDVPEAAELILYARGLAAARAAWPGDGVAALQVARAAARALGERAESGAEPWIRLAHVSVLAAVAAAVEERDELELLLRHAADLDAALPRVNPPLPPVPTDELGGVLWLQVARFDAAREAFERAVSRRPGRARGWLGLARSLAALNRRDEAEVAYDRFLSLWTEADPERPELQEARRHATGR